VDDDRLFRIEAELHRVSEKLSRIEERLGTAVNSAPPPISAKKRRTGTYALATVIGMSVFFFV
jgi:hypothetical protein